MVWTWKLSKRIKNSFQFREKTTKDLDTIKKNLLKKAMKTSLIFYFLDKTFYKSNFSLFYIFNYYFFNVHKLNI